MDAGSRTDIKEMKVASAEELSLLEQKGNFYNVHAQEYESFFCLDSLSSSLVSRDQGLALLVGLAMGSTIVWWWKS